MPRIDSSEIFISHFAYDLAYDELHEQAKWVFYKLDSSRINGPISRTDKFKIDLLIVTVLRTIMIIEVRDLIEVI